MSRRRDDGGAVAVEMAIVLPILLILVFGIIDFGRMLNAQITITAAAREGARWAALSQPDVPARVKLAAPGLDPDPVTTVDTACSATPLIGDNAVVTARFTFKFITPLGAFTGKTGLSGTKTLTGRGVMRCGG